MTVYLKRDVAYLLNRTSGDKNRPRLRRRLVPDAHGAKGAVVLPRGGLHRRASGGAVESAVVEREIKEEVLEFYYAETGEEPPDRERGRGGRDETRPRRRKVIHVRCLLDDAFHFVFAGTVVTAARRSSQPGARRASPAVDDRPLATLPATPRDFPGVGSCPRPLPPPVPVPVPNHHPSSGGNTLYGFKIPRSISRLMPRMSATARAVSSAAAPPVSSPRRRVPRRRFPAPPPSTRTRTVPTPVPTPRRSCGRRHVQGVSVVAEVSVPQHPRVPTTDDSKRQGLPPIQPRSVSSTRSYISPSEDSDRTCTSPPRVSTRETRSRRFHSRRLPRRARSFRDGDFFSTLRPVDAGRATRAVARTRRSRRGRNGAGFVSGPRASSVATTSSRLARSMNSNA